jgi:hypothetical protein
MRSNNQLKRCSNRCTAEARRGRRARRAECHDHQRSVKEAIDVQLTNPPFLPLPLPLVGTPQLLSNISACLAISQTISSTLGPRGMDKLIVGSNGQATISNDGATILKLLDVVHPAAKTLVDIARAQDAEVGDGTTSVVLLAAEFMREAKPFIEDGVSPHVIIKAYRKAAELVSRLSCFLYVPTRRRKASRRRRSSRRSTLSSLPKQS